MWLLLQARPSACANMLSTEKGLGEEGFARTRPYEESHLPRDRSRHHGFGPLTEKPSRADPSRLFGEAEHEEATTS